MASAAAKKSAFMCTSFTGFDELIVMQRGPWIYGCSPPGRNPASNDGCKKQQQCRDTERERIMRMHSRQQSGDQLGQTVGSDESDEEPHNRRSDSLPDNEP